MPLLSSLFYPLGSHFDFDLADETGDDSDVLLFHFLFHENPPCVPSTETWQYLVRTNHDRHQPHSNSNGETAVVRQLNQLKPNFRACKCNPIKRAVCLACS